MKKIFKNILNFLKHKYKYIEYLYIYYFYCSIEFFENMIILIYGKDYLEELWIKWYLIVEFYKSLWFIVKKKLLDKLDTIVLDLIWKIKRSNNIIVKFLKKYLEKYDWFNNNIIKF